MKNHTSSTSTQPSADLNRLFAYDVADQRDTHVGNVAAIWRDANGFPAFLGFQSVWLAGRTHVVPVAGMSINHEAMRIRVPFAEEQLKNAPTCEADSELDQATIDEICAYYGVSRFPILEGQPSHQTIDEQLKHVPPQTNEISEQKIQPEIARARANARPQAMAGAVTFLEPAEAGVMQTNPERGYRLRRILPPASERNRLMELRRHRQEVISGRHPGEDRDYSETAAGRHRTAEEEQRGQS